MTSGRPGPAERQRRKPASGFMALGAMFGFVVFRRDAEHVVATDADAVDHRLRLGPGLAFAFLRLAHAWILAHMRKHRGSGPLRLSTLDRSHRIRQSGKPADEVIALLHDAPGGIGDRGQLAGQVRRIPEYRRPAVPGGV